MRYRAQYDAPQNNAPQYNAPQNNAPQNNVAFDEAHTQIINGRHRRDLV